MMLFNGLWIWHYVGELLLWVAGVLTFITGYQYFQKSVDYVKSLEKAKTVEAKIVVKESAKKTAEKTAKKAAKKTTKKTVKKTASKKTTAKKTV